MFSAYYEQGNGITAWVDASQIYGETYDLAQLLRDHDTDPLTLGRDGGESECLVALPAWAVL